MATHGSAVDPTALLRRSRAASRERLDLPSRLLLLLIVVTGAGVLLSALFLPTAIAASDAVGAFETKWLDIPPLPEDFEEAPENSVILASDGTELAVLHGEQNRVTVRLSDIPLITRNAVIATEDSDFWTHNGVNHQAIMRALLTNVRSGSIEQGGSTITQQYVKLKLLTNERTLDRKLREVVWAVELEDRLSKEEILESYLNTAYFGDGVYGIGTAARYFFSKPVTELDLRESALLAGLIRSPERNNPLSAPRAARARRSIVLEQMR
ncbi:MAG TPA: biosynthetic peptidoglycan transglycosylase, partial [Solirubrobacteraceae bacterium]|nr:biosynthetic peptidoglycan transglycosylase [Solirubrobacteraceae bacterium]